MWITELQKEIISGIGSSPPYFFTLSALSLKIKHNKTTVKNNCKVLMDKTLIEEIKQGRFVCFKLTTLGSQIFEEINKLKILV